MKMDDPADRRVFVLDDESWDQLLAKIDSKLAEGWKPDGRDVDDIVSDLRAEFT